MSHGLNLLLQATCQLEIFQLKYNVNSRQARRLSIQPNESEGNNIITQQTLPAEAVGDAGDASVCNCSSVHA